MPRVVVVLADGFEEVEAIAIIDVLRRAAVEVVIAGLHAGPIESARKVRMMPDSTIDTITANAFDMIVLPGGQPGSDNLNADGRVKKLIQDFSRKGKLTGAICAAPYVLGNAGILKGKRATAFPTYKDKLGGAVYEENMVVEDGNVITSRGPGTALCFGLALAKRLVGKEKARQVREAMLLQTMCDERIE